MKRFWLVIKKEREGKDWPKEKEVEWKGTDDEKGDEKWRKEGEGRSKGSAKVEQSGKEVMRKKEGEKGGQDEEDKEK